MQEFGLQVQLVFHPNCSTSLSLPVLVQVVTEQVFHPDCLTNLNLLEQRLVAQVHQQVCRQNYSTSSNLQVELEMQVVQVQAFRPSYSANLDPLVNSMEILNLTSSPCRFEELQVPKVVWSMLRDHAAN